MLPGARPYVIAGGPPGECTATIDRNVQTRYYGFVTETITRFRKDLFRLADEAMKGEIVQFTYKGVVFQVKPEKKQSKLEKLVGQTVVAEGVDLEQASKQLQTEMEASWNKDWTDL